MDALIIYDLHTQKTLSVNQEACELFECSEKYILDNSPMIFFPKFQEGGEPTGKFFERELEKVAKEGENRHYMKMVSIKGKELETEVSTYMLYDTPNSPLVVIIRDITERLTRERMIKEQKDYLSTVINLNPNVIFARNKKGQFVMANKAAAEVYGIDLSLMKGKRVDDFIVNNAPNLDKDIFETGKSIHIPEYKVTLSEGNKGVFQITKVPVKDAEGNVSQVLSMGVDITKDYIARAELRRLNSIISQSRDAVVMTDVNGSFIYINDAARKMYGIPKDMDIQGRNELDFIEGNISEHDIEGMKKKLVEQGYLHGQSWRERKDGTKFLMEFNAITHYSNEGNFAYISSINRDITQQHKRKNILETITSNIARAYSDDFLEIFVRSIAESLEVLCCTVNVPAEQGKRQKILVMHFDGKIIKNELKPLDCMPCKYIYENGEKIFTSDLQKEFPTANETLHPDVESYAGLPIKNSKGEIVAHICIFDTKPIEDADFIMATLRIYASRIGAELERTAKEKALENQKNYLRSIIDLNPNLIFAKDKNGIFTMVNKGTAEVYGSSVEEVIGKSDADFNSNVEEVEFYLKSDLEVFKSGEIVHVPLESITDNKGEIRHLQTTKMPVFDENGEIVEILGVATDITAQIEIERSLRESETKFKAVFNNSSVMIGILDQEGNLIQQNLLAKQETQSIELLENRPIWESFWFSHNKKISKQIKKDVEQAINGKKAVGQCSYRISKSEIGYMSYNISPIYLETGELFFILAEGKDITDLISSQQQLSDKVDELNEKNTELKRYIESNLELENFAYIASHDLREPLRTITSFAGILDKQYGEKLDETGREFLNFIVSSAKSMNNLIRDLLTFSRVHSEESPKQNINVERILEKLILVLDKSISDTGTTINLINIPKELKGNGTQVTQLFQNLISNGIKFRKKDIPCVIDIAAEEKADCWEFSVTDNGIGIQKEFYDKVFMLFKRLHTSESYEGTGIGLSLCKKIVERHGGEIWLESEVNKGTSFYFTIQK